MNMEVFTVNSLPQTKSGQIVQVTTKSMHFLHQKKPIESLLQVGRERASLITILRMTNHNHNTTCVLVLMTSFSLSTFDGGRRRQACKNILILAVKLWAEQLFLYDQSTNKQKILVGFKCFVESFYEVKDQPKSSLAFQFLPSTASHLSCNHVVE